MEPAELTSPERDEAVLVAALAAYQRGDIAGFTDLYVALAPALGRYFAAAAGEALPALRPHQPPSPSFAVEVRELGRALERLPRARREAWLLHQVHGWSFAEIAARTRVGINAVKLRSSRAMRALRAALAADSASPGGKGD